MAPEPSQWRLADKPKLTLFITNLADREIAVGCSPYRLAVHLVGGAEPEKTEFYRHILGDFRPGDKQSFSGSCFSPTIQPNQTFKQTWDLSAFYVFVKPGRYTASVFIADELGNPKSLNFILSNSVILILRERDR